MNRLLLIPAVGSFVAFIGLIAVLHGAPGRELSVDRGPNIPAEGKRADVKLTDAEAEQALTKLTGEYLRPWREFESSPKRLYSRAAPRPIPSISATVELAVASTDQKEVVQTDNLLVATVIIKTGSQSQRIPCVVDRENNDIRLFAADKWVTSADWVKSAPLP